MTYEEFLAKLRGTSRGWTKTGFAGLGMLRNYPNDIRCCPITAILESPAECYRDTALRAAHQMGLSYELAEKIIDSADGWNDSENFDAKIRKDLLEACGVGTDRV